MVLEGKVWHRCLIFFQIFSHSGQTFLYTFADRAFCNSLGFGNFLLALAQQVMRLHPAALNLRQFVQGTTQTTVPLHEIEHYLRGKSVALDCRCFNPILCIEGILRFVVIHAAYIIPLYPLGLGQRGRYFVRDFKKGILCIKGIVVPQMRKPNGAWRGSAAGYFEPSWPEVKENKSARQDTTPAGATVTF